MLQNAHFLNARQKGLLLETEEQTFFD